MTLEIEFSRSHARPHRGATRTGKRRTVLIGLVNNMPDTALEATEAQFARVLSAAADSIHVRLRFYFLPEVPRGPAGLAHVKSDRYWPVEELRREPPDALIVTGTEPVASLLSDEPYWERIRELLHWAEANTTSSIWSCLAAHAAVELLDGIRRRRLEHKRFGVFAHDTLPDEALLKGVVTPLHSPHSRWNELPMDALRDAGYTIVSASAEAGADMFTKQMRSLLVFFQGHPEYEETTLLREYRRDVGRFLRGQQAHYPHLPRDYFPPAALELLSAFEARALAAPTEETLAEFPTSTVASILQNTWSSGATGIYRNWLALLASRQKSTAGLAPAQASPSGS
jgi:homoserine O-succinyltransferase/O-acetyltransferase